MLRSLLVLAGLLAPLASVVSPASATAVTYDVRGGDAFTTAPNHGRCTIGFSVQGGYITSGKCGAAGMTVVGHNGVTQGTIQGVSYPGDAGAWVRTNSSWRPRGLVNRHNGTTLPVRGAVPAPVGAAACMSGATSGWRCGVIQARNVSVSYPDGVLTGLIRTNICATTGDLGAPLISNGHAQGTLVGTSGTCVSYFLPVAKILSVYGLTLVTE